jgi:hypothetical protein
MLQTGRQIETVRSTLECKQGVKTEPVIDNQKEDLQKGNFFKLYFDMLGVKSLLKNIESIRKKI